VRSPCAAGVPQALRLVFGDPEGRHTLRGFDLDSGSHNILKNVALFFEVGYNIFKIVNVYDGQTAPAYLATYSRS
jgi:hypothetical protein